MIILDITINGNYRAGSLPQYQSIGLAFQPLGPGVHFAQEQLRKRQTHYAATLYVDNDKC